MTKLRPDVSQIGCLLLIAAPVGALLDGKAVALIEPLGPHIRYERPQLQPAWPPLLGQLNEPGAEPAAGPCRVHIQLLDPVTVQDHQAQHRAVIGDCEPGLLFIQNTVHPMPDLIVRMRQRRDLWDRMMASAQVNLRRNIRVSARASSQLRSGIHLPIVARATSPCKCLTYSRTLMPLIVGVRVRSPAGCVSIPS